MEQIPGLSIDFNIYIKFKAGDFRDYILPFTS
jgi:hypothetical protein